MDTTRHSLLDNKVQLYRRPNSPHWQCATSVAGRQRRTTTREESLARAKDVARDWYLGLLGKYRAGELREGKTFKEAAEQFEREIGVLAAEQKNKFYVVDHKRRIKIHLLPFFGEKALSEINPGQVQEYRIHRHEETVASRGKPPARQTMHQEIVTLRQILKCANRHGWLPYLPDLSEPFKASGKISHRAWFSPVEYKKLYEATRQRVKNPPKKRWLWSCEQLHDYVLFAANTGLRPDEALRLQFRDVEIVEDEASGETILEIQVRGKRGVGYCKSMPNAVLPFQRLRKRERLTPTPEKPKNKAEPKPTDLIFPQSHHELFNIILDEEGLKFDREGNRRTAYSLRHTYICMRLMEGADIYQIAKNCRTSVEMIEKYYASHIKTLLDAAAINVRKPRKRGGKADAPHDET